MYEMIKEFIKPEFLLLIPALYILGMGLKKSPIYDKWIPFLLGDISVILCGIYVLATAEIACWQDVLLGIFTAVVQGILCAGASVYVNQIVKQSGKYE